MSALDFDSPSYRPPIYEKRPEINLYYPEWWHGHGDKMQIKELDIPQRKLVLAGSAAELSIEPMTPRSEFHPWAVSWRVIFYSPTPRTITR